MKIMLAVFMLLFSTGIGIASTNGFVINLGSNVAVQQIVADGYGGCAIVISNNSVKTIYYYNGAGFKAVWKQACPYTNILNIVYCFKNMLIYCREYKTSSNGGYCAHVSKVKFKMIEGRLWPWTNGMQGEESMSTLNAYTMAGTDIDKACDGKFIFVTVYHDNGNIDIVRHSIR
jgi:hypothetical protein